MLMAMRLRVRAWVSAWLVNWLPCSVFMIPGAPKASIASSSASTQGSASSVIYTRCASTPRLYQSITAARYT